MSNNKNYPGKFLDKTCSWCNEIFMPSAGHQKFCDTKCRDKNRYQKDKQNRKTSSLLYAKRPKYIQKRRERYKINRYKIYGLTEQEFQAQLKNQNKKCLGCETPIDVNSAKIDHNHATGKVRGLLCLNCNWALGQVKDNITILSNLIKYLEKYD